MPQFENHCSNQYWCEKRLLTIDIIHLEKQAAKEHRVSDAQVQTVSPARVQQAEV